jgi:tetratricopeptide (TPR) repeat protein
MGCESAKRNPMTPQRFFTTSGQPFAYTRLDRRAGIPHERGCYVMADDGESVPLLPARLYKEIQAHCHEGERLMTAGNHNKAFHQFLQALDLLPLPREQWNAAGWILVAVGENAVRAGSFQAAEQPLQDAMWAPGTIGNPWVHLRLGQVKFELGDMKRAADELTRAYVGGGREIFEDQDPKYFALVEEVLKPPPGMDQLP